MADTIRLVLVDDHTLFRELLRRALADHPRLCVVGEADNTEAGIRCARDLQPNIVVMDLNMPGGGGVEATRVLRAELPSVDIVVVTGSENDEDLLAALRAGAKGYVMKTAGLTDLVQSLEAIAQGHAALSPEITAKLLSHLSRDESPPRPTRGQTPGGLSERELEVLRLVAQGATNRQIANQLYLSEHTVRTYLAHILEKLGLDNRAQAAAYAVRNGLA
jgi:two-component system nitrate/nitrite response regulator NarL